MLHIILLILKIIGIILAAILGIAVLLLLLLLFVPLRYKMTAVFPGTLKDTAAELRANLFFHLVSCRASYKEGKVSWRFRIAWKKWDDREAEPEEEKEAAVKERTSKLDHSPKEAPPETEQKPNFDKAKSEEVLKLEAKQKQADHSISLEVKQKKRKKKKRKWRSFLKWGKTLYQKLLSFIERIKCTFRTFCAKIKVLQKKKEVLEEFIENKTHKDAFQKAKKEAFRLLKSVKPRIFKARIVFGFDDPYLTGKTLAGLSMIYPFIGGCTSITPDFEQEILKGELYIKGNLRVIYFVIPMVRLLLDKNIRRTYKHIKNLKL